MINDLFNFSLASRLKEIRVYKGFTSAEDAARFLKFNRTQYTRYEAGKQMNLNTLFYILNSWGISFKVFFSNDLINNESFEKILVNKYLIELSISVIIFYDDNLYKCKNIEDYELLILNMSLYGSELLYKDLVSVQTVFRGSNSELKFGILFFLTYYVEYYKKSNLSIEEFKHEYLQKFQ